MTATIFQSPSEAQAYADKLTLDSDGTPLPTESPDIVGQLLKHGVRLANDIFAVDKFLKWNSKVTETRVQQATASNPFGKSGPCPISEEEFGKHAPNVHCIFFSDSQLELLKKAFPTGIGQPLRVMKKWGEGRLNVKTGKKSGGRYKTGAFGYFLNGVVAINVEIPNKGIQTVKGRPTINMALEGTNDKSKAGQVAAPMTGAGEEEEEGEGEGDET